LDPPCTLHSVHCEINIIITLLHSDHWHDLHYPLSSYLKDGDIHDIWNGDAVKLLTQKDGFFTYPEHLGLSLSTDGVPVFKSSPDSLWPVYLTINNLPPRIRTNKANTILCGLWFGPKPAIRSLLQPVVEMLQSLYTVGITIKVPSGIKTVRAMLLNGIFDLVAKAPVVNMTQFNGEYGCLVCTHPGCHISRGRHVYLPNHEPSPVARTHASIMKAAQEAEASGVPVRGIKGISVLANSLDLVDGIPVDYMHSVLEGVTRWLLRAWFKSENHREPYYLGRSICQIDNLLLKQRPPSEFSRPARSIRRHVQYWKATELRSWLLFYSLPLLLDFLPSLYFHHFALLVCALHILLQDCLSTTQINAAEEMLRDFTTLLPELYGERSCTANAHLLIHLPKYVRLWGPLWTHSAFGFESCNGHLKYLFHSQANIVDQLVFNVDVQQTLQLLHPLLLQKESAEILEFLNAMNGSTPRRGIQQVGEHTYTLGKIMQRQVSTVKREVLGIPPGLIQIFTRIFHNGTTYHSASYFKGMGKRNNQVCYFNNDGRKFGQIQFFTLDPEPAAVVKVFEPTGSTILERAGHSCRPILEEYKNVDFLSTFIHEIKPLKENSYLMVVPISRIEGKAVHLQLENSLFDYVLKQPNDYEHN